MRVRLAYGTTGLDIEVDPEVTTVVEPVHQRAVADPGAALRAALRHPVAGPAAARAGAAGADRRDLGLRRDPPAAAAADDPGHPRRARRDHPPGGRRHPRRHRHPPRQRRGRAARDVRRRGRRQRADRQPRRAAPPDDLVVRGRARQRRAGVAEPGLAGGRRADHDRVRRAAFLRRVLRRPEAGRPRAGRPGHRARAARRGPDRRSARDLGHHSTAIRSTTTSGPSRPPPGSPSAWT